MKFHTKLDFLTPMRSTESGIINQVMVTTKQEGLKFVKALGFRIRATSLLRGMDKRGRLG